MRAQSFFVFSIMCCASASIFAATPISETRAAKADVTIEVSNAKGAVLVSGWDRDEVSITGSLGDGSKGLSIEGEPGHLRIKVRSPEQYGLFNYRMVEDTRLELKVPQHASLKVDVVSADVKVDDVAGKTFNLDAVSGKLKVACNADEVRIESVSGDVDFEGKASHSSIETVSGNIDARGLSGRTKLETVSGRIRMHASMMKEVTVGSVSGDIEIRAMPEKEGRIEVETMSGNLQLFLLSSLSARIEAETFSGVIKSDFGEVARKEFEPGSSLDVHIGSADAKISAQSFSGNIELRRDQ